MVGTPSHGKKGGYYTLTAESLSIAVFEAEIFARGPFRVWLSHRKTGKIHNTFALHRFAQKHRPSAMKNFWRHCLTHLQGELPQQQYRSWIEPLHCAVDGHVVTLTAPNRFVLQWVRDRFLPRIQELVDTELGTGIELRLHLREKAVPASPPAVVAPEAATGP